LICHKFKHHFTGLQVSALTAEIIAFVLGASFNAARFAKPGRFKALAPEALPGFIYPSIPGRQQVRAGSAKHSAISMQDKFHVFLSLSEIP